MNEHRKFYEFGRFRLDPQRRRLMLRADGTTLALPPRVFDTLLYLIEHRGELVEKLALMKMIWPRTVVEENSLNRNIFLLRRALGEEPGDHTFIVTAPGQGYRFVADVRVTDAPQTSPAGSAHPARRQADVGVSGAGISVAVLPLENLTGNPACDYLCFGIAEELIHALSGNVGLSVANRASSFAYQSQNADEQLIARELGVKFVLKGSIHAAADKLAFTVRLVEGKAGAQVWSQLFECARSDLLAFQDEIARSVRHAVHAGTPEGPGASRPPTRNVKIYHRLLEAEWFLHTIPSESAVRNAIELMEQVVREEPSCARAFAALGAAHSIAHGMRYAIPDALAQSERYARRALELDAGGWDPHIVLAEASRTRGHWEAAGACYGAGVELGHNAPMAFARRSMGLWLNVGCLKRAFEDALQAHLLAPARPETALFVALAALASSHDEEARWYVELANELGFPPFFGHMPVIAALLAVRADSSAQTPVSCIPPAGEHSPAGALAVAEKWQLIVLVMRGAIDEAYACARRLLDAARRSGEIGGEWWMLWLQEFRPFRRDLRFQELTAGLGLKTYWQRFGPPDGHDFRDGQLIVP